MSDHPQYTPNRLRALHKKWNNPPSPELPDGAELLLEAADEIDALVRALGETARREGDANARCERLQHRIEQLSN